MGAKIDKNQLLKGLKAFEVKINFALFFSRSIFTIVRRIVRVVHRRSVRQQITATAPG